MIRAIARELDDATAEAHARVSALAYARAIKYPYTRELERTTQAALHRVIRAREAYRLETQEILDSKISA